MRVEGPPKLRVAADIGLRPGQVVEVRVVAVQGDRVQLRLGGSVFQARTDLPLEPGTHLRMQVARAEPAQVVLRVLAAPPSTGETVPDPAAALAARAFSAHQLPLAPEQLALITRLVQTFPRSQQPAAAAATAWLMAHQQPAELATVLSLVRAQDPAGKPWGLAARLETVAKALEQAIAGSDQEGTAHDLRTLAERLRNWGYVPGWQAAEQPEATTAPAASPHAPPGLGEQVEAATEGLARITGDPTPVDGVRELLAAIRILAESPSRPGDQALFPLPFHLLQWKGEAVLLVDREPQGRESGGPGVAAQLTVYLDAPNLGPLAIRLRQAANGLSVNITTHDPAALEPLRLALPNLKKALSARGLNPIGLMASRGDVGSPEPLPPPAGELPHSIDYRV